MTIELQYKIKTNEHYIKYLRENSNWYKHLNRNPNNFKNFEDEVKKAYKLTRTDKISNTLKTIEMMEKILSTLK